MWLSIYVYMWLQADSLEEVVIIVHVKRTPATHDNTNPLLPIANVTITIAQIIPPDNFQMERKKRKHLG